MCAPLGSPGDKCCKDCFDSKVSAAREAANEEGKEEGKEENKKRSLSNSYPDREMDLHVRKKMFIGIRSSKETAGCLTDDGGSDDDHADHADHVDRADATQTEFPFGTDAVEKPYSEASWGVEFENANEVGASDRVARCAIKPPPDVARSEKLVVDVVVLIDDSASMENDNGYAVRGVLHRFEELVKACVGQTDDGATQPTALRSTNVKFCKFGNTAMSLGDFVSCGPSGLKEAAASACRALTFRDRCTNTQAAMEFAGKVLRRRLEDAYDDDVANGVTRVPCVLLVTDGTPNEGEKNAALIHRNVYNALSDSCRGVEPIVFAIGISQSTNPHDDGSASFLSRIVGRHGYWKHASSRTNISRAFWWTFGTILNAVDVYRARTTVCIERGGATLSEDDVFGCVSVSNAFFGLYSEDARRGRFVDVLVPRAARVGDVLVATTRFGRDVCDAHVATTRVAVVEKSYASVTNDTNDDTNDDTNAGTNAGTNATLELFDETKAIEDGIEELKKSIASNRSVGRPSDGTLYKVPSYASPFVQAQMERITDMLGDSLVQNDQFMSSMFTPYQPSNVYQLSNSTYTPLSYTPSYVRDREYYSQPSKQSALSQIDC